MTGWVILVDSQRDFPNADTPHKVITTSDYLARPRLFEGGRTKVINLSRSYNYQSRGYYASLLGEARGHRMLPTVETMLELRERKLYEHALPELEDALNRALAKAGRSPEDGKLLVCFGIVRDEALEPFGKLLFDWFRCPALQVSVEATTTAGGSWASIERIRPRPLAKLDADELVFFREALHAHTRQTWKTPRTRAVSKYSLAVLHDPADPLPPSSPETLRHFAKIAEKMSVDVEPITRRDLSSLSEFDALFIRATTSIDNYTYRFARRAMQEGMPVIDDPVSMIRCTNKVYLTELLMQHGVPIPPTVMIADEDDIRAAIDTLGLPLVVKIPDGSFSRGVHKLGTEAEVRELVSRLFQDTDLLLAQKFMPTAFDWRVGVLGGEPLFACQYHMAKGHWQILKHDANGTSKEGGHRTVPVEEAPREVIDIALKAARPIGKGLYGVDLKETPDGIVVIEVNDNPNLDHGVEDQAGKDAVWTRLLEWFIARIDA